MNSKSVKEGGKHNMYSKSKRFIASFLAVLMAVCMLPADMFGVAGVAYAAALNAPTAKVMNGTDDVTADIETGVAASSTVVLDYATADADNTTGASIRYAIGTDAVTAPTSSSEGTEYTTEIALTDYAGQTVTIKAVTISGDDEVSTTSADLTIKVNTATPPDNDPVAEPTIVVKKDDNSSATDEEITAGVDAACTVEISAGNDESIRYNIGTENVAEPTATTGTEYVNAIALTSYAGSTVTIRAIAYKTDDTSKASGVKSINIKVNAATVATPTAKVMNGTTEVTETDNGVDAACTVVLTADGTDEIRYNIGKKTDTVVVPASATDGTKYENAITLTSYAGETVVIKAIAVKGNAISETPLEYEVKVNLGTTPPPVEEEGVYKVVFNEEYTETVSSLTWGTKFGTDKYFTVGAGNPSKGNAKIIATDGELTLPENNKLGVSTYTGMAFNSGGAGTTSANPGRMIEFTLTKASNITIGAYVTTGTDRYIFLYNGDTSLENTTKEMLGTTVKEIQYKNYAAGTYKLAFSANTMLLYIFVEELDENAVSEPKALPVSGSIVTSGDKVVLSADEGVEIRYTTDGTEPSATSGTVYDKDGDGIEITTTPTVIKAIAVKGGKTSEVETFEYKFKLPAPISNKNSGVLTTDKTVTLTDENATASIYYTLDGTVPTDDTENFTSELYNGAITINETAKLQAIAVKEGYASSDAASYTYVVPANGEASYVADGSDSSKIDAYFDTTQSSGVGSFNSQWDSYKDTDAFWADFDKLEGTTKPTKSIKLTAGKIDASGKNSVQFATSASTTTKVVIYHSSKDSSANLVIYKLGEDGSFEAVANESYASVVSKITKSEITLTEPGIYAVGFEAGGGIIQYMEVTENPGAGAGGNTVTFTTDPTLSTSEGATLTTPHPGDVLTVSYALNLAAEKTDDSTIAWYRVKDGQNDTPLTADTSDNTGKTYTVVADDVGSKIKVVVTPKDSDGTTGTAKDAETGTVRVAGETNIAFATAPALSISDGGNLQAPKPDDVLTVSYALDSEGTDASIVEWYRGDTKIATATGKTYTVTTDDIGSVITVKVTPQIADGTPGDPETASTGTVVSGQQGGTVTLTSVTLTGETKVGQSLTANATFDGTPDESKIAYAWYRVPSTGEATLISGADAKIYTATKADVGYKIKVVVTYDGDSNSAKDAETKTTVTEDNGGNGGDENVPETGLAIKFDDGKTYIYTGAKITPSITVYNNGTPLVEGTDYTVKYTNNVNASHKVENDALTATQTNDKKLPTVTVTGKGSLSKKVTANFNIIPKALDNDDYESAANADTVAKVSAGASAVESKKATPVLLYGGAKLAVKKNFAYDDTTQQNKTDWDGETKLKLNGVNNFTGSVEITVNVIAKADQANAKIKADFKGGKDAVKNLYYDGTPHIIGFEVSTKGGLTNAEDATDPLVEDTDYVISYPEDLTNVGAKKVTITGISSRCTGSVTKTYKVIPANKNGGEFKVDGVDTVNGYDYVSTGVTFDLTGENAVTVKYVANSSGSTDTQAVSADGESLVPGKDFKISYSNNKKVGTAKYTVTGLGNYKGVVLKNQEFTINGISLSNQNDDIDVTVADVFYNKKGAYKSVPYVTVNGKLLKASEYVAYYTVEGENESEVKGKTRNIVDEDFADNATSLSVTVTIEAKGKNVIGPDDTKAETKLSTTFNIIKKAEGYDKTKDLSKAKITFFGGETKNKVGYTGKAVYPTSMVVKLGSAEETVALDATGQPADKTTYKYTIVYADNVAKGKATAVVMADDGSDYVGGKAATFNIVPKALDSLDTENGEGFIASFMKGLLNK